MSVQEIETAIAKLPPEDLVELAVWFDEFQAQAWDEQIARDVRAGRFESLIQRAKEQFRGRSVWLTVAPPARHEPSHHTGFLGAL